jgi:succinoglycan biosynthesis transport protein ExoP
LAYPDLQSPMNAATNDFPARSDADYRGGAGLAANISYFWSILRRGWFWPLLGCLLGLALGVGYVIYVPDLYKSSARILLDRSVKRYLQTNNIVDEPILDETETGSQIYVLSSDSIVVPVVRSMKLAYDPEFAGAPETLGEEGRWSPDKIKKKVMEAIGLKKSGAQIDLETKLERTAVEKLLARLTVYREDAPNVINVTFASEDPKKAADIANALTDTYISATEELQLKSSRLVSQVLEERLNELKQQVVDADQALQNYKTTNNLVSGGKGLLGDEQLSTLSTQLTNARIAVAEARARLDRAAQLTSDGSPGFVVSQNDVTSRLRSQYLDLSARAKDIESRVGPNHIAVIAFHKKLDEMNAAIREEEQRIAKSYAADYRIAQARNDELSAAMTELSGKAGTAGEAVVKMHQLESTAETLHNMYNGALRKFNEIKKSQSDVPAQDAHVITRASPPLQKTSKKSLAVLAGSVMFGLLSGMGLALAREWAADVFRTPEQVRRATGVYCVTLPTARRRRADLHEYVLDAPFSRFAETIRNIRALTQSSQCVRGDKIVGVVSSVSKEGKTTIVSNLASLMSASAKARVLIIDCDLHRRHLTRILAPDQTEGLIEALKDPSRLAKLVVKLERSGVDVLPCTLSARIPNAAELLGSTAMEHLLDAAREAYDFVLIEIAPIMSVADIKMVERFIDKFIFVIEWGQTKRCLVNEALTEADSIYDRLLCVVLNKADPAALRSIEAYKGRRIGEYYEG